MVDDQEIAKKAERIRIEGKDYAMVEIPDFMEWCEKKSSAGCTEAVIDHMLATSMFLLPEELKEVNENDFEEIYQNILSDFDWNKATVPKTHNRKHSVETNCPLELT